MNAPLCKGEGMKLFNIVMISILSLFILEARANTDMPADIDSGEESRNARQNEYVKWRKGFNAYLLEEDDDLSRLLSLKNSLKLIRITGDELSEADYNIIHTAKELTSALLQQDHLDKRINYALVFLCSEQAITESCVAGGVREKSIAHDASNLLYYLKKLDRVVMSHDAELIEPVLNKIAQTSYYSEYYGIGAKELKSALLKYEKTFLTEEQIENEVYKSIRNSEFADFYPDDKVKVIFESNKSAASANLAVFSFLLSRSTYRGFSGIVSLCESPQYLTSCQHMISVLQQSKSNLGILVSYSLQAKLAKRNNDFESFKDIQLSKKKILKSLICFAEQNELMPIFSHPFDVFFNNIEEQGEIKAFELADKALNSQLLKDGYYSHASEAPDCNKIKALSNEEYIDIYGISDNLQMNLDQYYQD